jgi:putative intracellular protease/amidase
MEKIAMDYHNNDLVAEVKHFIDNDKLLGALTDYEWLDHIAAIVNGRKMTWGSTDCTTGLVYKR